MEAILIMQLVKMRASTDRAVFEPMRLRSSLAVCQLR